MKTIKSLFAVLIFSSGSIRGAPIAKMNFKEISGIVVGGSWFSQIDKIQFARIDDDVSYLNTVASKDQWYLVIKSVKGISTSDRKFVSDLMEVSLDNRPFSAIPHDLRKRLNDDNMLLIIFRGGYDERFKRGTKITLSDVHFSADERGGSMTCSNFSIETTEVNDPPVKKKTTKAEPARQPQVNGTGQPQVNGTGQPQVNGTGQP